MRGWVLGMATGGDALRGAGGDGFETDLAFGQADCVAPFDAIFAWEDGELDHVVC
jgi:hypothetical protein